MIAVRVPRGSRRGLALTLRLVAIAVVLWVSIAAWAFSSPPGSAPDEPQHLAASWAVTHGQAPNSPTFRVPAQIWHTQCHRPPAVPASILRGLSPCIPPTGAVGTSLIEVANTADLYPPGFHWLIGQFWGSDLTSSVYRMRAFVALGCTVLLMIPLILISMIGGVAQLRRFGPVLLVCLSPLAFFLFGSVNPSSWAMAGAVCSWGSMVALVQARRLWQVPVALAGMVLGVLAGAFSRPGGGAMLVVGLLLAAPIALGRLAPRVPRWRRTFWAGVTIAYVAFGVTAVTLVDRGFLAIQWGRHHRVDVHPPLWHWLTDALNIGHYLAGSFTRLGWVDTPIPSVVALTFAAVTGFLVLSALRRGRGTVLASLLMLVLSAWYVTTAVLATGSPPDSGLQTRYVWPLYIGIPMIAALATHPRRTTNEPDPFAGHVRLVVGLALVVASSIAFFTNLRRYTVGLVDFPFLTPDRWSPPVWSTGTLLVTFLAAYTVLVVLLNAGRWDALHLLTGRDGRDPTTRQTVVRDGSGSHGRYWAGV